MIAFHRLLISTGIVFCVGFAWWMIAEFRSEGNVMLAVLGASFLAAGGGLMYYLRNLKRFLGR